MSYGVYLGHLTQIHSSKTEFNGRINKKSYLPVSFKLNWADQSGPANNLGGLGGTKFKPFGRRHVAQWAWMLCL